MATDQFESQKVNPHKGLYGIRLQSVGEEMAEKEIEILLFLNS